MSSTYCPDCEEKIRLRNPRLGQKLRCPFCDTELEVISVDPLDLDWAYASDYLEDDDEDEDEDEDEDY